MQGRVSRFVVRYYSNVQKNVDMAFLLEGNLFLSSLLTLLFFSEEGGIQPFALYNMKVLRVMTRKQKATVKTAEQ